jgi:hypothetical protein
MKPGSSGIRVRITEVVLVKIHGMLLNLARRTIIHSNICGFIPFVWNIVYNINQFDGKNKSGIYEIEVMMMQTVKSTFACFILTINIIILFIFNIKNTYVEYLGRI